MALGHGTTEERHDAPAGRRVLAPSRPRRSQRPRQAAGAVKRAGVHHDSPPGAAVNRLRQQFDPLRPTQSLA
eukprot:365383-Chlamydomonas_euryale.AAC.17